MENLSDQQNSVQQHNAETEVDTLFAKAVQHHGYGELSKAESLYQRVLAAEPHHLLAMKKYGVLAFQFGDYVLAEQMFEEAYSQTSFDEQLTVNLVLCKMKLDKAADVLPLIQIVLQHNPDNELGKSICSKIESTNLDLID